VRLVGLKWSAKQYSSVDGTYHQIEGEKVLVSDMGIGLYMNGQENSLNRTVY